VQPAARDHHGSVELRSAALRRPNVLFLLADDLRRDAVGAFGGGPG